MSTTAKEHYDNHLAAFYSWMAGDFNALSQQQYEFFKQQNIFSDKGETAIDLGAGHGIQSAALARLGFKVKAVDFNEHLLTELKNNCKDLSVETFNDDILNVSAYSEFEPALIVCCGDTLTHLSDLAEIENFIASCCGTLKPGGCLLLSFRDYTTELVGDARFIPVKSDENRILTCFIEYQKVQVRVTDLLHEREGATWKQKPGSYFKVRVPPRKIEEQLIALGMSLLFNQPLNRMVTIIAQKPL